MKTTRINGFEISYNDIDYKIDFEVDLRDDAVIDSYSIIEVLYYDWDTGNYSVSVMFDNEVIELLQEHEDQIIEML